MPVRRFFVARDDLDPAPRKGSSERLGALRAERPALAVADAVDLDVPVGKAISGAVRSGHCLAADGDRSAGGDRHPESSPGLAPCHRASSGNTGMPRWGQVAKTAAPLSPDSSVDVSTRWAGGPRGRAGGRLAGRPSRLRRSAETGGTANLAACLAFRQHG